MSDVYSKGREAGRGGRAHNPHNSRVWKEGWRDGLEESRDRDRDRGDRDDDAWMIDPEMEAKG